MAHQAGPPIVFEKTARQRCVWCGALIQEQALLEDEADNPFVTYRGYVEVEDGAVTPLAAGNLSRRLPVREGPRQLVYAPPSRSNGLVWLAP